MKIACLQNIVPHYREEFFEGIKQYYDFNVYLYGESAGKDFQKGFLETKTVKTWTFGKLLFFDFKKIINDGNQCIIFPFQAKTTLSCLCLILLCKLYGIKVILWGHGISIFRYLKEEKKENLLLKLQLKYSDGCWLYMKKEKEQWSKIFPKKTIIALNNTITGADQLMIRTPNNKNELKNKYGICERLAVIYCARCTKERRFDLLIETIKLLKDEDIAFIIIGAGDCKPDFSSYKHVYDYGAVYDKSLKDDLFDISDVYFQPGWVGLSIVEAMLYGKPVLTFKRTNLIYQCVEYSYIENNINGQIVESVYEAGEWIKSLNDDQLDRIIQSTKKYAQKNLSMKNMVNNAVSVISQFNK